MSTKLRNVKAVFSAPPYEGLKGKFQFLQYIPLKFARPLFSSMSIVPFVREQYELDSDEEFRVRYYASRIDFDELWTSKDRITAQEIESFYAEHDKDIWRQAYLSKYNFLYRKKILRSYHVVKKYPKGARVLDYGCGAGAVGHYIASKGYTVDVADIPSKTLDFVRARMSDLFRKIYTVQGIQDFGVEEYDVVSALDVLEHTLTPLSITEKLIKSLKRGGVFHVVFPVETDFSDPHTQEAQIQRPEVFEYLRKECDELVPELLYKKR